MVSSSLLAEAIFVGDAYTYNLFHMKTLRLLKQARIKIVARAICIYLFFFLIDTLSSSSTRQKVVVIAVLLSKLDRRLNCIYYKTILV